MPAMLWGTLLGAAWLRAAGEELAVSSALAADDACAAEGCGVELMQVRGSKESKEISEQDATWQGVRETGSHCVWSCDAKLGPTECYHFRCVCKVGYIYSKEHGNTCLSRDSVEAETLISKQDTGATCRYAGCEFKASTCQDGKCLCIPGYEFRGDGCKLEVPKEAPTTTVAQREEEEMDWPDAETDEPPSPAPAAASPGPAAASPAPAAGGGGGGGGAAACAANPGCAKLGLAGDCCPAPNGMRLGCC